MTLEEFMFNAEESYKNPVKGVPFSMTEFRKFLPYFQKGERILLCGDTGSSKTSFTIKNCVIDVVKHIINTPDLDGKVIYFSIELSSKIIYAKIYSYLINKLEKVVVPLSELVLPTQENTVVLLKKVYPTFKKIMTKLEIIDNVKNPKAIYEYMVGQMSRFGILSGSATAGYKFTYDNPNFYIFCIVDTINALVEDVGFNQFESIKRWSEVYAKLYLSNRYDVIIINIQQLDVNIRTSQFAGSSGQKIEAKHKPTLGNLATVKTTPNDHTIVMSLFMPNRYGILSYKGLSISNLGNRYVEVSMLKSNFTELGDMSLYYDGPTCDYELMPDSTNKLELEQFLDKKGIKKFVTNKPKDYM